jgi:hypothetical protein
LFSKFHGKRDAATHSPGFNPAHPAIVAGSYIALLIFAVLLHRGAWNGAWKVDDARQLLSVINNPFRSLLFDDAWRRTFATNAFTPILAGQYWVDMHLFGLKPRGFNLHHAAELAITALATYHLLSRRIPRHLSLLATVGFIVALPTFTVMNFLTYRHYLTGLLLSIGSVYMYQRALRDGRTKNLIISVGLFFLAMLAKELYVLALLYFFLTSWRTPLFRRVLVLYPLAFIVFAAWRAYMLGSFVGGYPNEYAFIDRLAALDHVHRAIFGSDLVAAIFLASVAVLILRHRLFGVRHLVGLAAVLVAIYLPLLFSTFVLQNGGYLGLRLSFFPAWLCAVGLAYIAALLSEAGARKSACILMLAFVAVTAAASARRMDDFRGKLHEYDVQAGFIESAGPASALFPTSALAGFFEAPFYQQVALAAGHSPAGLILFRDDISPGFTSYWEYSQHCRCLVQIPHAEVLEKASHLDNLNKPHEDAPISLLVTWQARQGMASIAVEPEGEPWCLLSIPGMHFVAACTKSPIFLASRIPKDKLGLLHAQVFREGKDGQILTTPYMSAPTDGTWQWSRGVFLPSSVQIAGSSGICHIDSLGKKEPQEIHLSKTAPLELRGWILGPSNTRPDTIPLAILAGSSGKNFVANLHRESRPDVTNPNGMAIGGHIRDANLRRVEPGAYRLLLGVENTICDTGIPMTIR